MGKPKYHKYRTKRNPVCSKRSRSQRLRRVKESLESCQEKVPDHEIDNRPSEIESVHAETVALGFPQLSSSTPYEDRPRPHIYHRPPEIEVVHAETVGKVFPQLSSSTRTYGVQPKRSFYQDRPPEIQTVHAVEEGEDFPQLQRSARTYGDLSRRRTDQEKSSVQVTPSLDALEVQLDFTSEECTEHANSGNSASNVADKVESILPDVPNLAIVKTEPVDDTEDILPSTSGNIPSLSSSSSVSSVKLEFTISEDCVDDMTVSVNPNDITPLTTLSDTVESSSTPFMCTDGTEPPPKRPNLTQSPPKSSTEIKDEFTVFGSYVADKLRSFTDRRLQVEAQHRITNLLFEIEMKDLKEDSLPVISKISSLEKTLPAKVILPSSSAISKISSLKTQIPATVKLPSGSAIRISNLQTLPVRTTLPSSSAINRISNLQPQLPATVTLHTGSAVGSISSLQTQSPGTVTLPFSSPISRVSSFQVQMPATMMLPPSLPISSVSNLQEQMPVTVTLPSSSPITSVLSLQKEMPVTVTLPSTTPISSVSSLQGQVPVTVMLPSASPLSTVSGFQEQKPVIVTWSTSSPISIASNVHTELPATVMLPSSSVIPVVPFTSGNTIDLNTQVGPDVSKQT